MDLSNDSILIDSSTGISADDESISKQTASPVSGQPPSPNDDNTPCENIHSYSDTATDNPITELSPSPAAESLASPNKNTSCENMYHCSDTSSNKSISELTGSPVAGPTTSPNDNNTPCENIHHFPNTSVNKLISEPSESPVAGLPPSPNHDNSSCENTHRYSDTATNKPITKLPTIYEEKPTVEHDSTEAKSTPLQNRDQMSCIIDRHSNPADFKSKPIVDIPPLEADPPPIAQNENACLYIVLCPSDGGFWPKLTCVLGFLSLFIIDGICSSLFLMDNRVGMAEYLPSGTYTLEHLAVIYLFRYLTGK